MGRNPQPSTLPMQPSLAGQHSLVTPTPDAQPVPMRGGAQGVLQRSAMTPSASTSAITPDEAAPKVPQFRVTVGGWCQLDKMRVPIRVGKIVDETQYDLVMLQQQGIELVPLDPPVASSTAPVVSE